MVAEVACAARLPRELLATLVATRRALRLTKLTRWLSHELATNATSQRVADCRVFLEHLLPGRMNALLDHPTFGAIAEELRKDPDRPVTVAMLVANLADCASAQGQGTEIRFHATELPPFLPTLTSGRVVRIRQPADLVLSFGAHGPVVIQAGNCGNAARHGIERLTRVGGFALDDLDQFMYSELPAGSQRTEGAVNAQSIGRAVEFMSAYLDELLQDVRDMVTVIIPAPTMPILYGGTSPVMTGAMTATLGWPPVDVAELLVHEAQHSKLAMLLDHLRTLGQALLSSDQAVNLASPWRGELRPAEGLLHGCASFAGVARMWALLEQQRDGAIERDVAGANRFLVGSQVLEAITTLRWSGRLTPLGDQYVAALEVCCRGYMEDVPPSGAIEHVLSDERRLWYQRPSTARSAV